MLKRVFLLFIINLAFSYSYCFADENINSNFKTDDLVKTANSSNNTNRFNDYFLTSDKFNNIFNTYESSNNEDSEVYALKQNLLVENKESKYLKRQGKGTGKVNYTNLKNTSSFFDKVQNKDVLSITLAIEPFEYSWTFAENDTLMNVGVFNIALIAERYFKKKGDSNFRQMIGFSVRWHSDNFAKIYEETVSTTEELGLKRYEGFLGKNAVEFGLRYGINYQRYMFGLTPYIEAGYGFGSIAMEAVNKIEPRVETRYRHKARGAKKETVVIDTERKKVYDGKYFNQFVYAGIGIDANISHFFKLGLFIRTIQPLNDLVLYNLDKKEINCGEPFIIYGGVMFGLTLPIVI